MVALTPLNLLHKNNQKHVIELHVLPLAALSLNYKKIAVMQLLLHLFNVHCNYFLIVVI